MGQPGRRTFGRLAFLNGLGLAVALIFSAPAAAGPPVAGMLAAGLVGQAHFGTIKGRLVWGGAVPPPVKVDVEKGKATKDPMSVPRISRSSRVRSWSTPRPRASPTVSPTSSDPREPIRKPSKALIAKNPKVELDQIGCEFMPYTLAIHQDQTLVIKSSDPKRHNVRFNSFNNGGVNEIVAAERPAREKAGGRAVSDRAACDIHPWMKGYLMVFDHPFFTITGPDGSFEIKGVPAGNAKPGGAAGDRGLGHAR